MINFKKVIAKEILVVVSVVIVFLIVYVGLIMYNKEVKKSNSELYGRIKDINSVIIITKDSLYNFPRHLEMSEYDDHSKPWERFDKKEKPKFNPNKSYEILSESDEKRIVNRQEGSSYLLEYKRQISKLSNKRELLVSQLNKDFDLERITKKTILILLLIAYPLRLLILGTIWSVKVLRNG